MTAFLYAIFFASGASSLIFETLWFHQAALAFGNSVWACSLVLSGFMGGLAVGNALAARYGDRFSNPIRIYAIAEAVIALTGIGLIDLFPVLGVSLAPWFRPLLEHLWLLNSLRFLIAVLLLLIPSTAMGVTLPLLTKALMAYDPHFGSVIGRLYGWNTFGAVSGVVVGETYLLGAFGVRGTALAAGALNLAAATAGVWLSTRTPPKSLVPHYAGRQTLHWAAGKKWLVASFLSGFCLLALEVVWFRFLLLFVVGHSVAFALMLGIVLAGVALGGLVASQSLRFWPDAHRFASSIAFTAGFLCVITYGIFPLVLKPFAVSPYVASATLDILRIATPLLFPVSLLSGVFFTLAGAALRNDLASETTTAGVLTLANTTGAALGSLLGTFLLLPVLGMEKSFFIIAALYGGIGLLLLRHPAPSRIAYATAVVFLLSIVLFPFGSMKNRFLPMSVNRWLRMDTGTAKVTEVREGLTETVIYFEALMFGRPVSYTMLTNSYSMSGTENDVRRYMKLYVYWPMAVHPHLKHALLIGYGIGNTAKAMTDSRSLETIDVVDTSRNVLEMNHIVYPDKAEQPLQDPRVRIHIEDGRYFLQMAEQRFDLITGEPPPPGNAGVVNLYTREYFQLLHDRLAEGGIATYWLPIRELTDVSTKAILRAFCDVFEDCSLWNGAGTHLMMVGSRNAEGPVSEEQFNRQWNDPVVGAEMRRLGFERPEQLGALFIGDADYLRGLLEDSPPLVDNYPKLIEAPFSSEEQGHRLFENFTDVSAARERFRRSHLIKNLWPERLQTESLPYFEFQNIINTYLYGIPLESPVQKAHMLLTRSTLSTLVLWCLGSDSNIQQIVANAGPKELASPDMQLHLGIRLISERKYAAAVAPLSRAEQLTGPQFRHAAIGLHVYALCMLGRTDQARQLAQERSAQFLSEPRTAATGSLNGPVGCW